MAEPNVLTEIRVHLATLVQKQDEHVRRLDAIDKKLEEKVVTKPEHEAIDERVTALEDTIKWLSRTIIGAVLLGGLTAIGLGKKVGIL